ncbi:MAG: M20/M25/M40 family metallo-hydrolase [Thermoanaerobaculia bacterium]
MTPCRTTSPGLAALAVLALTLPLAASPAAGQDPGGEDAAVAAARAHRQAHEAEILRDYAELLKIPNVASDTESIRRNAEVIRDLLSERGVEAELWTLPDTPEAPPIVYGRLKATAGAPGDAPTLGVYVHYDGQPVDPSQWTATSPWEPALYSAAVDEGGEPVAFPEAGEPVDPEWRLYARASGDDKAPIPAILTALDALEAAGVPRTANLVFFFEGEEEAGSPHLERYMRAHRNELRVDAWLICDGPVHQSRRPQLVFGVRGYTGLDITVYGARRYLHSGHYGNWAPNPGLRLAHLLASLRTPEGEVLVKGFGDSTVPPTEAELDAIAALPAVDGALRRELGLAASEMDDAPLAERILHPSLNIRGMESAAVGDKARNVIPTTATASIDIRLAKGNDPVEMLDLVEAHVRRQGYHIVRDEPDPETRLAHPKIARIDRRPAYRAARTPMDTPVARRVIAAARRPAGDDLVLLPTLGGSLPLYLFEEVLDTPIVIVPIANHDNNQHAPDENLRIANLWYGIDLMAALFTMEPDAEP